MSVKKGINVCTKVKGLHLVDVRKPKGLDVTALPLSLRSMSLLPDSSIRRSL